MTHDSDFAGGFFSQPRAVWAVAFAAVVSFMGLGWWTRSCRRSRTTCTPRPARSSCCSPATSRSPASRCSRPAPSPAASARSARCSSAGPDHRLQRRRGRVEQRRRDRRLARRVGSRERALHRHLTRGDHRLGQRRRRRRGRALRGGARPRDLRRAAARRRARRDQLARPVLRRRGVDGDRVRRDQRVPAAHPAAAQARARLDRRAAAGAASPRDARERPDRDLLQLRVLHSARVHAVPSAPEHPPARLHVHRLGAAAGAVRRVRGAARRPPLRRHPRPGRRAGRGSSRSCS